MKRDRVFISLIVVLLGAVSGCTRKPEAVEETATRGKLFVMVAQSFEAMMRHEAEQYQRLYPDVSISVVGVSTREAIVHLLNDSVKCIGVDRPLNGEERDVAGKAEMLVVENKIGEGALALIVHPQNKVGSLAVRDVKDILNGSMKAWRVPSRSNVEIDLTLPGRNSGTYELLQKFFFAIEGPLSAASGGGTDEEVVRYVESHPQALGIVSIAVVRNQGRRIKVLDVEMEQGEEGQQFVKPTQINIYRALYPFRYSLYLYTSESSTGVGAGFSTFIRSMHGQKIVQDAGFVPVTIPNRIIQLNTE